MAPGADLAVAVVGYGYWGSKHVRVLNSLPGVTVTVVDEHPERLASASTHHPGLRLASSLDAALDDCSAVVVATPPATHAGIALRAVEAGKNCLVEKPLTTSVSSAETLVDAAAGKDVQLMVGHTFEYNPAVWKLRQIARSGELGRILYIDAARLSLGRYQSDCNVIWDLAPHDISIISYLLGEVPSRVAVWSQRNIGRLHADLAYLRLEFARASTHAFVRVSWLNPNKVRRVTVVGDEKMAVYDDMSDDERIRIYDIGVDPASVHGPDTGAAMPITYRTGDITSPYIAFREPLLLQDEHFVECIRSGRPVATPGERGLDVVRVLAAADVATETGWPTELQASRDGGLDGSLRLHQHERVLL